MDFLKRIFGDEWKKFLAMAAGAGGVVGQENLGMSDNQLLALVAMVGLYVLGQGIADFGKGRALVEAKNGGKKAP